MPNTALTFTYLISGIKHFQNRLLSVQASHFDIGYDSAFGPETVFWEGGRGRVKRQLQAEPSMAPDALKVAAKQAELQGLLQQLYQAQAMVKMESSEVSRTQQVAEESEQALEEATNKVRMLSGALQSAQEAAAAAAVRAHTAHLHLSAHDTLMFNARQRVDAISSKMVSVQADLTAAQEAFTLNNSSRLLEQQGKVHDNPVALYRQQPPPALRYPSSPLNPNPNPNRYSNPKQTSPHAYRYGLD